MKYNFTCQLKAEDLDQFVAHHPRCNLLQSSKWALVKDSWDHLYCGVYHDNELVGTAMVLIKHLPLGFTMFYLPKGPVLDFSNRELVSYFFDELKKVAKSQRCLFIKFDPNIIKNQYKSDAYQNDILPLAKDEMDNLKACGCLHMGFSMNMGETIQPRFHATAITDENWEKGLPKHTKRHIQTAKKRFIEVKEFGIEKAEEFTRLTNCTEAAKNIRLRDQSYFEHLLNIYGEDARLFLACIDFDQLMKDRTKELEKVRNDLSKIGEDNEAQKATLSKRVESLESENEELKEILRQGDTPESVAGTLAVCFGDSCEMLYMGTDRAFRRYMPAYLSHYAPIKWSADHGYRTCNMGGVEGSLDDGLTKFKSNFNPDIIEYVGEFELPVNKVLYQASHVAYKVRKSLIHLLRK